MLVIHLINGLGIGGGEQLLADLVRGLDRDFQVGVYCLTRGGVVGDSLEADGISVHRLTRRGVPQVTAWRQLLSDLRRASVIHTHFFYSDLLGSVLGRIYGVRRRISTRHDTGYWMRSAHVVLEPWIYRGFHQVLCVSQAVIDSMRERGVSTEPLVLLPPGVVAPPKPYAQPRTKTPWILAVGRLEWVKGHDSLLQSFADFVGNQGFTHWRLKIVGGGTARVRLERLARDLGISHACIFSGELGRQEVWNLLDSASMFVLPSRCEAMPLSLIEAMRCGVPCVASSVGGVPELITHDYNGLLVDAGDRSGLAQAMATLASDPEGARRMGELGRLSIEDKYDLQRYVRDVVESYRGLKEPEILKGWRC